MELRRTLMIAIGALVLVHLATSFGAITVLTRMSPAIEQIIDKNVASIESGKDMLIALALSRGEPASETQRAAFERALATARDNVSESDEAAVLDEIAASKDAALDGDGRALARVVARINHLSAVNQRAIRRIDREAKQLAIAGAWWAVLLAAVGLVVGLVIVRQTSVGILAPIGELYSTLECARTGEHLRRCKPVAPTGELKRIFEDINALLDERARNHQSLDSTTAVDRAALVALLERLDGPTFVVDPKGRILATNEAGLNAMHEGDVDGIGKAIEGIVRPPHDKPKNADVIDVGRSGWILTFAANGAGTDSDAPDMNL
ncbi:MAG: hypothetical protein R3A78_15035 [Polyangiales bacterium]